MSKQKKYIFVTGGVLSSIGKGISAASLGMLLEQRGIRVTMVKMDPYLNVDPGTMSPVQHGEVFVLDDGAETDLDLGHYSRFVQNAHFTKKNSFTTGRVYDAVIRRERAGGYLGKTVQVIPHITDEIKNNIRDAISDADLGIIEVGGTVGDIESLPFLEAIRQIRQEEGGENVLFVHLTLVPFIPSAGELKTKPTQHSVKELREIGIQPDILLCRSDRKLPSDVKEKIALFCNMKSDSVFSVFDVNTIYSVPLVLNEEGVDEKIMQKLGIWTAEASLEKWKSMVSLLESPLDEIKIAVIGKYTDWQDSYKSLNEALIHGGVANQVKVNYELIESDIFEKDKSALESLKKYDGVLVPGGFGVRGVEGKIEAIRYARENQIPFFGICLGMQLAVIEFARNQCGIKDANSFEFDSNTKSTVVHLMEDQKSVSDKGGTMRLGAYECIVSKESNGQPTKAYLSYESENVSERHRHRFEVSNQYREVLVKNGLIVSGKHVNKKAEMDLVEMIELSDHPWFLGCQFHPEFKSQPLKAHPLFRDFIKAAKNHKQNIIHKSSSKKNGVKS